LEKDFGVGNERFVVLDGATQAWHDNEMEIWLVPNGARLPDPHAEDLDEVNEESVTDDVQQEIPEAEPPGGLF
jgi:hypothetical protein